MYIKDINAWNKAIGAKIDQMPHLLQCLNLLMTIQVLMLLICILTLIWVMIHLDIHGVRIMVEEEEEEDDGNGNEKVEDEKPEVTKTHGGDTHATKDAKLLEKLLVKLALK